MFAWIFIVKLIREEEKQTRIEDAENDIGTCFCFGNVCGVQ